MALSPTPLPSPSAPVAAPAPPSTAPAVARPRYLLFALLLLVVAAAALALRVPRLDLRPMHTDEAVHAVKLGELIDQGRYIYNPDEYHGPTIYYFTLPLLWLTGVHSYAQIPSEIPLRLTLALFGAGMILLSLLVADGLGRRASLVAGLLTALSPAMVFYSRYYIQEILFVFFTFATIAAAWRYTRQRRLGWAIAVGVCMGFMQATKETCVIVYFSMIAGALLTAFWSLWIDRRPLRLSRYCRHWHVAVALAVALVVGLLLLSAFLTNPHGLLDAFKSYAHYLGRGSSGDSSTNGSAVHNHPWHFYLHILAFYRNAPGPWWSEGLTLALALVGVVAALRPRSALRMRANIHLLRFLAFYTILMTAIYSAVPYKTPWCLLGFLHGMILMAGVGAVAIWSRLPAPPARLALLAVFALGCWNLGAQAGRASNKFSADTRNPYVYGHTSSNLLRMVARIEDLQKVHPAHYQMVIKMVVPGADYWPLPWYLRRFPNIGYWNGIPDPPEDLDAPIVIVDPKLELQLENGILKQKYITSHNGLRPDVVLGTMVQEDLWEKYLAARTKAQ